MKKYLLDTHCLIWYHENDSKLSAKAENIINNINNIILFSQVSLYEVAIKESLGKLPYFKSSISDIYQQSIKKYFIFLHIKNSHLESCLKVLFYDNHRDPFDKLLIAKAIEESAAIITIDNKFHLYNDIIEIIW